ncbi:PKD domain-containing protein [Halovenus marina]|uniref:PKD domain-containing protein n=1 Tax=Halovenus marina TaxID=3396621 RepID=UPI003F56E5D5
MTTRTTRTRWLLVTAVALLVVVSATGLVGVAAAQPTVSISQTTQSGSTVAPGDTVTVEATMNYGEVNSPGIDATLPSGWTVVSHTDDGGSYGPPEPAWVWLEGDNDGVNGSHTVTYTVQVPSDAAQGTYTISADGTAIDPADSSFVSSTDDLVITVDEQQAPTADAGSDQTVDEETVVTLDASGSSDPDGDSLSYSWTVTDDAGTGVTLSDASAAQPTFTAPTVESATTLSFEVEVSDGNGNTDTDTVEVTVQPVETNQPPTADAGQDQTVDEGASVSLDASGSSDPDGDTITYTWSQTSGPDVSLSDAAAAQPTVTAPSVTTPTTLEFMVTVSDGNGGTDTDTVAITVQPLSTQPSVSLTQSATSPTTVSPGGTVSANVTLDYEDINSPGIDVTLPSGWTVVSHTDDGGSYGPPEPAWVWLEGDNDGVNGSHTVTYTVQVPETASPGTYTISGEGSGINPADGASVIGSGDLTVTVQAQNEAPTADAGDNQTVDEGTTVALDAAGSADSDGSIETYAWTQTDGPSVTLSDASSAAPTFDAPDVDSPTTLTFELEVTDDDGATDTDTVTISVTDETDVGTYGVSTGQASDVVINTSTATNASATLSGDLTLGDKSEATTYVRFWVQGQPETTYWYDGETMTQSGEFDLDVVLSPSTTYMWQTLAESGDGDWKVGQTKTFTTPIGQFFGATTDDPTEVGVETATLNGELLNLGDNDNATVYFTYWEQGQKESTLTWYTGSVQNSTGPFNTTVELDPGTAYAYRAFGQSNEGEWKAGPVKTFTTQADQAYSVTTDKATAVASDSATLNGELTGLGDYDSATVYFTYWKQGQKGSTLTWWTGSSTTSPGPYSADVTGLDSETTYVVQAYAQSDEGKWTAGSQQTVTTSAGGG